MESKLSCRIDTSSFNSIVLVCMKKKKSPQSTDIVVAAVTYVFFYILNRRNRIRFDNHWMNLSSVMIAICSNVHLAGTFSIGTMHNSIADFCILKSFSFVSHPCK